MQLEDTKFRISQLRADKIIYAVEACATSLVCLLGVLIARWYLNEPFRGYVSWFLLAVAIAYTVYMGIGNFIRLSKIKELERGITKE